jgi:hypothetical protein
VGEAGHAAILAGTQRRLPSYGDGAAPL